MAAGKAWRAGKGRGRCGRERRKKDASRRVGRAQSASLFPLRREMPPRPRRLPPWLWNLRTYEAPTGARYLAIYGPWGIGNFDVLGRDKAKLQVVASTIAGWLKAMFADAALPVETVYVPELHGLQSFQNDDFCIAHLGSKDSQGTPVDIAPHIGTHMWKDFLITTPAHSERYESIVLEYDYAKNGDPAEGTRVVMLSGYESCFADAVEQIRGG
jgi:hypothetical protein